MSKLLTESDYERAANELGVEVAVIKAVAEVESSGGGFVKDTDKPKILFEGHIFWKRLKAHGLDPDEYEYGNREVLYPSWTREHYIGGLGEYDRLEQASKIHLPAALESASWGRFQIMGYHAKALGYESAQVFVNEMYKNEGAHLDAFVKFIQVNNLAQSLKDKDFQTFARGYNGKAFKENDYDGKMERAYAKYSKE